MTRYIAKVATIVAASMLVTGMAHAQQAAPAAPKAGTPPAQTAPTPPPAAPQNAPRPATAPTATAPVTFNITPQAQAVLSKKVTDKQAECAAKGRYYRWTPPHMPGDVNPRTGKEYAGMSLGSCRLKSSKVLADEGLINVNAR